MFKFGEDNEVKFNGKTWTLGRVTVAVIEGFRDWVKEEVGDPFAPVERVMALGVLEKADLVKRIKEAEDVVEQLLCFSLDCPLAKAFCKTERGSAKLFHLMLQVHHPTASLEDAFALAMHLMTSGQMQAVLDKARGALPNGQAPAAEHAAGRAVHHQASPPL